MGAISAAGLTTIMNWEVTRIVVPFWPPGVYLSLSRIMAPPRAIPILCQMKIYICSGRLLTVSWWLPYLVKGPTPDFNSGPGNDSYIGCIFALQHLFKSNLNNSPSPSHSSLASVYTSVQVSYLRFPGGCHIFPRAASPASIMA